MGVLRQATGVERGDLGAKLRTKDDAAGKERDDKVDIEQDNEAGIKRDNNEVDDSGQDNK